MSNPLRDTLLQPRIKEDAITRAMRDICGQLNAVDTRFAEETDSDLLDACLYERLALQARYRYLCRMRRQVKRV